MTPARILVVEDNATARKLFRLILQTEGFEIVEAEDARTALVLLEFGPPPALILQDLLLPDMVGLDLMKAIRALPCGRDVPIVALSGFRSIMEEAKLIPLGFDATLVKPVDRSTLLATVRSLLPAQSRGAAASGRGRRVLLVDDDAVQSKLVRLRLLDAGFDVTSANSGATAFAMALEAPPAVVLSDVLMPEMDGFELCAEIRRETKLSNVPVVLMSAHFVDENDGELGRRVGAFSLARRTPELTAVLRAVEEASTTYAPAKLVEGDFPVAAHRTRLAHRLKQLAVVNEALLQRCTQQAAQLSIVGGISEALARSENVDTALQDILATCLDAGGISRGVLFRPNANGVMTPDQAVGFSDAEHGVLRTAFATPTTVDLLSAAGKPVALSTFFPQPEFRDFTMNAGVTSAVIVPVMTDARCTAALLLGCGDSKLTEAELLAFGRAIESHIGQALALTNAFRRLNASGASR